MKLAYVHPGDLVEVDKGGRRMVGRVVEVRDGVLRFEPLCRGISYRHATAREVIAHWRRTGRRGPGPAEEHDGEEAVRVPDEQLSLPMANAPAA